MAGGQGQQMRAGAAMAIYSELIPEWIRQRAKDYFVNVVSWVPLAANTTSPTSFTVDSDSDFLWVATTGESVGTADPTDVLAYPLGEAIPILLQVQDAGSGRLVQSAAAPWDAIVGRGEAPFFLPYPKLIARGSTVTVTAQNQSAAAAFNVRVCFHGFKIFGFPEVQAR